MSVLHMHRLLTDNVDGFTWHNYARKWQNDHHIPLERIKLLVNNGKNYKPLHHIQNLEEGYKKAQKSPPVESEEY